MASSDGKRPPITGLDNLMRILTRIKCKNQDYLDPDSMDVWNDAQQTDTFSKYPEPLCSILGSLVDSKLCMKAVNRVQMLLRKRIDLLQKSSNPLLLEHGIKAMPNELLAKVFEIGHYAMEGCEFSLRVSHVSHRFRQIAIRTPLLWSRISGLYPASQIKVFLSRAGQLGLRIQVCPPSNEKAAGASLESFLGDMRTYSNQCEHLNIHSNDAGQMQEYSLNNFPRLKCLKYAGSPMPISEWKLPSLSRLVVKHDLLDGYLPHAQLTSVDLSLGAEHLALFEEFGHALHRMTNLRELKLNVECHPESYIRSNVPYLDPHSVCIDTLNVTMKGLTDIDDAQHLYATLEHFLPKNLFFTLDNLADAAPHEFFTTWDGKIFPYGSTIDICIFQMSTPFESWDYFPVLTSVVGDCKIAETVRVQAPDGLFFASEGEPEDWECYSSLRTLQFIGCRELYESELKEFADHLISPEDGRGLLSLEVYSCRGISNDFLEDLEETVGKKLRWTAR